MSSVGSPISVATSRARSLDMFEETQSVSYALAHALATGRASCSLGIKIAAMKPAAFAQIAIGIAATHGGKPMGEIWEAWRAALA